MAKIAKWSGLYFGLILALSFGGCSENSSRKSATLPAEEKPAAELPPPVVPTPADEAPAAVETPETRPASALPVSTYESKPPYPVELFVSTPQDEQPGWLKILTFANKDAMATTKGLFPEQNKMIVDTQNVERIQIHIGHLPLASKKRIMLRIDNQPFELLRNKRNYVTLSRRPTGEWILEPTPKD